MEINRPFEIKVEIDPIAQSLRLHGVAEKIRAERGPTTVKVSCERFVWNHLVRVADFHPIRNVAEFFRSIGIKGEWVADGQRRDHGQAFNITELFADPQRIQSIEHSLPQHTFLLSASLTTSDAPRTRPAQAPIALLTHECAVGCRRPQKPRKSAPRTTDVAGTSKVTMSTLVAPAPARIHARRARRRAT